MLDIKFLRENPDVVKQNIKNKFQDRKLPLVDEVIELDKENREIKQEVQRKTLKKGKAYLLIPIALYIILAVICLRITFGGWSAYAKEVFNL